MNFDLNEEQALLQDLVTRFVSDRYDPVRRLSYIREPRAFSDEGWRILAEAGLLAMPFPESSGGLGGGAIELITVVEALGRGVATEPFISAVLLAAVLIDAAAGDADDDIRQNLVPALMSGEKLAALALLERSGRFLPAQPECIAQAAGEGVVLSGTKTCVLGGGHADWLVVTAQRDNGATGVYLVDAAATGMARQNYRLVDGSLASDIHFDRTPARFLPHGADALPHVLDQARLAIIAELVGLMTYMFDATVEYVKTRKQFGQPIGTFQAVQHRLADAYALVELSRSQLYRAAAQDPGDDGVHRAIVGAKAYISANAMKIGEEAIQLHGGIGTTEELMVGQAFKRVMLLSSLLGDTEWDLRHYVDLANAA